MSSLKISRNHSLGIEEAKRRVDKVADDLGGRLRLTSSWDGDHLLVKGSGVSGRIVVEERCVDVHVHVGFAMLIFRESIRSAIEESIDDYID